ncbi:MAG: BON domain-containing protein [Vitreoscilla sp.]|nr:BON domain-containing protein [Vitreoscilla sp.]
MTRLSFDKEAGIDLPAGALNGHLAGLGLRAEDLDASFDALNGVVSVRGCAPSQDMRERIVLCCGNVRGVAAVDDRMTVVMPSEVSRWRFVQPGETLARIALDLYRDASRAQHLRAANQPLIGDADTLAAGWLLRVPV